MSEYDDDCWDDDGFDDFPTASHARPGQFPPDSDTPPDRDDEDDGRFALGLQYSWPKPPLRSRPPINFSRRSTIDTNRNFDNSGTSFDPSRSHMSGSTLRSGPNHLAVPRKSSLRSIPPDVIAALTENELLDNPIYRNLRADHYRLSSVLAKYAERDLSAKSEDPVPTMYQVLPRGVRSCRADSCGPDSRASSLGPSDSASQPTKVDMVIDKAIEDVLESVEAPLTRPRCLPDSVLWDFKDLKSQPGLAIVTEANKSRPKIQLALRRPTGDTLSHLEQSNIRRSADIIVKKLLKRIDSDPRSVVRTDKSKPWSKTLVWKFFPDEYDQAILELEAEQKVLRLCSAHWKADAVVTKVFQRIETKAVAAAAGSAASLHSNFSDNLYPSAPTASIPRNQEVAPMNVAKRALELSPGPKSPSASHAQKRSKDDLISGQRTVGTKGFLNESQRSAPRKITPAFLNRIEMVPAEPAPTKLRLLHVDPSADNLIAILTTSFPSLTDAPRLLRSMNAQSSFKQSEPSEQVATLLDRVQFVDPSSPDIDEDNACQGWGHEQFTAGGVTLSSSLTSWQEVGNVATALKLVAAAIKTCQEARLMCKNAGTPKTSGFISDIYLEKTLECLESCWVGAGGVITSQKRLPPIPTTPSYRDVAMSPPPRGPVSPPPRVPMIKIKRPAPVIGIAASNTPEVPAGANSTNHQPAASTGPTGLDEGARADSASLKLLQVHELQALFSDNNVSAPKSKRKDDLIAAIVISPELSHILKSTVKGITEKRKKGPKKQVAALP
ncbi:hypothetical protein EDB85DRAFT_2139949 [Lactarius pseudohatsudake]|nr:hypothetical protein EDB85DRAFT_2139949 [Lactarius pseudohatsudake]